MHIAVLATNTDDSDFAARHPRDVEKFRVLLHAVRPGWQVTSFDLPKGQFPEDIQGFDGFLIGGSPSSVHDEDAWIERLFTVIREAHAAGKPLAGACFGHQAIAKALGGTVGPNPGPFVLGTAETEVVAPAPWMEPVRTFRLAAAHGEQVTALPPGAEVVGQTEGCPAACYRIGDKVFATQYHPEMTPEFLSALVAEFAPHFTAEVGEAAKASLLHGTEGPRFAEWIARFFETPRA
ncbi:MAG: type 1 glutamine amidotransferase [Paracoccaceae bacterium]